MASTFKNYTLKNVTTEASLVTCPDNSTITIIGLTLANVTNFDTTVNVKLNDTYLIKGAIIGGGSAMVPIGGDQKVVLNATDTLRVSADHEIDAVVSVLEKA